MGLGLQTGGGSGEVRPYINYDAKAGRAFRIDRAQGPDGTWQSTKVDISRDLTFVADFANIRVGWISYTTQGPIRKLAVLGQEPIPPRPTDVDAQGKPVFKQGFELSIMLSKAQGGGSPREFSSTAACVIDAVDGLHDAYTAAPESRQGKLPVIRMADTVPVKSGQSTNYKPMFEIVSWVDRHADFGAAGQAPAAQPAASSPPSTGSTPVAPPAARPAPQPAAAVSMNDFG